MFREVGDPDIGEAPVKLRRVLENEAMLLHVRDTVRRSASEWAKHLRPYLKRRLWKKVAGSEKWRFASQDGQEVFVNGQLPLGQGSEFQFSAA